MEEELKLEESIEKRLKEEAEKIIGKSELSKEDVDILNSVLSNIHMKRVRKIM